MTDDYYDDYDNDKEVIKLLMSWAIYWHVDTAMSRYELDTKNKLKTNNI
jgi:hypothetical protein